MYPFTEQKPFSLLQNSEGKYLPGVFAVNIQKKLKDNILFKEFTGEEFATFVHEYIHFLQDISTQTGIIYLRFYSELLHLYLYVAEKSDVIELPIDLVTCNVENAFEQYELLSFYSGCDKHLKINHIDKIDIENEELLTELFVEHPKLQGQPMPQVAIYHDNYEQPYYFGGCCVRESMAYLIEHLAFKAEKRIRELPYNACEMICEVVCPSLLEQPTMLVALCELSLMHCNSGVEFYCLVKHIADKNLRFHNVYELKKYFTRRLIFLFDSYKNAYDSLGDKINVLYPLFLEQTKRINEQVKLYLKNGFDKRMSGHLFITDILLCKNPCHLIGNYICNIGLPMLIDCEGNIFCNGNLEYMPVPMAVLEFFTHPINGCGLIHFGVLCSLSKDKEICMHKPWMQCYEKELCPFAVFLRCYNIDRKTFKIKQNFA